VASWHVDHGVSGGTDLDERPALAEALGAVSAHGAGVLAVAKLDRVARDVAVFATVERALGKLGARIASAAGEGNGDTAADGFMRHVLAAAAQYERALIRSRTKAALRALRSQGFRAGTVPYGFTADAEGKLWPNEAEQATLTAVRELRAAGLSLRAIAAELARRGMLSRGGRGFDAKAVERMLAAI
jgi:DNA invertase Pin-like site-specific DNA recombinase